MLGCRLGKPEIPRRRLITCSSPSELGCKQAYLARAKEAISLVWQPRETGKKGDSGIRRPSIFLSTEDPATVKIFMRQPQWDVSFTNVPRKPDANRSTLAYVAEIGGDEEMLNSLVNLDLALECDAWIGTLSSNWCRLIDELRATVRCKAHGTYLDAEQENPPQDLNW